MADPRGARTGSEVCGGKSGDASQPSELLRALWTPEIAPMFWRGVRLDVESAWYGHVPFAHWIVRATRPRTLVELGTHDGVSYSAFCEAVVREGLDARCYAIDTWKGDDHAGIDGAAVYKDLRLFHDSRYGAFSELLRCEFDEALRYFPDDSVDLLHIDGLTDYEVVRYDFESWYPKLSDRAVVLLHDTNVRERDFGVWRLWDELTGKFPSFEFVHAHGLGVLGIGRTIESQAAALLELSDHPAIVAIRDRFALLGERWVLEARMRLMQRELKIFKARVVDRDSQAAQEEVGQAAAAQARTDIDRLLEENRRLIAINRQLQEARDEMGRAKDQMEARAEVAEAARTELDEFLEENRRLVEINRQLQEARDEMGRAKDQMVARAEGAEAAAAQARADVGRRAAELGRARAEIAELVGRISDRDQLRADHDQLKVELLRATQEGDRAREEAARIQALHDQLLASTVWRATWPIRAIGDRLPENIHTTARRAAKLAWWTVTLQLSRRLRERRIAATRAVPTRAPGELARQQSGARPVMEPRHAFEDILQPPRSGQAKHRVN